MTTEGAAVGAPVEAAVVHPPGETTTYYVATLDIPTPGWWRVALSAAESRTPLVSTADVAALDPGTSATLGEPAPSVHTPTLDDVVGVRLAVTTDPAPDLRLSRTSTTDALAQHSPFVLVIDSTRFRITSACGKAIVMARYLLDRWPAVDFIHLEPFRYSVVTDTAVLDGSLADPQLTDPATAWGIGGSPWGAASMPWVFVVDGRGWSGPSTRASWAATTSTSCSRSSLRAGERRTPDTSAPFDTSMLRTGRDPAPHTPPGESMSVGRGLEQQVER